MSPCTLFRDIILGQKFVMIIGKQTCYWSKTGFFISVPVRKVNFPSKFLYYPNKITSQNNYTNKS